MAYRENLLFHNLSKNSIRQSICYYINNTARVEWTVIIVIETVKTGSSEVFNR